MGSGFFICNPFSTWEAIYRNDGTPPLHPEKTKIVYCQDGKRKRNPPNKSFDFLGFTFRARRANSRRGVFTSFLPAISEKAVKKIRGIAKGWKLQRCCSRSLEEIAQWINPKIRGWIQYYGKFYKSELLEMLKMINWKLGRWARKKYKKLRRRKNRVVEWVKRVAKSAPNLFVHWKEGCVEMVE